MSDWMVKRLDEVADRVAVKNSAGHQRVLTVAAGHGLVDQETYFKKRVASSDLSGYWVVEPGDFVYNKSTSKDAPWGVVARWDGDEPAVVTTLYIVFRPRPDVESDYLLHACNSTFFFDSLRGMLREGARAHGLLNVRLREFFGAQLVVPASAEQRRVIDVMAAVDAQIATLKAEVKAVRHLLRCTLSDHFESILGRQLSIKDLCSLVVGGIWGSPEGENEVDALALGPRIYAPATTGFITDGSPMRSFAQKQLERRLVQPDDIILERSGGSPEQPVGRVVIAGPGLPPCIPTDFQRLMRPDAEKVEPRYLFWRLQHDWNAGLTRSFSRRTTGITNLSVKDYISREVPVPDRDKQRALVSVADAIALSVSEIKIELSRLRTFRSALLKSLLSQEIEIPESYDALLEEAC
ncbi:hypothetical protein ACWD6K_24980 [Streptomyces sp. NPDC002431]